MQTMTDAERKAQREAWEDKHYTIKIACPEHPNARHKADLFQEGHRFAGIWECPKTGVSDSHEHEETEVETAYYDYYNPEDFYGHGQREYKIYVCSECRVQVDGDPELDREEALADMQIMEALGK